MKFSQPSVDPQRKWLWVVLAGLAAALLISLLVGRYPHPYGMSPATLFSDETAQQLVLRLRLPRLLTAFLLGCALAGSGFVMQMLFRNPLVEPGFLGVTQGAAFGAALAIIALSSSTLVVEATAAVFAVAGLGLSYFLAKRVRYGGWILRLLLAGIAVSALFSAGVGILKYMADPTSQLPEIVFWMLGGLWSVTWKDLLLILPVVVPGLIIVYLLRWRLNLLALADETAFSLGVAVGRERALLLVVSVLITAAVVSVAGVVGWVGLTVPHIARRLAGSDASRALPLAILIGGIFTLLCDDLARTLLAGEIPLGILTALIGACIFIGMMLNNNVRFQR